MIDYPALAAFIQANYADRVSSGDDAGIANALNAVSSSISISPSKIGRAFFVPLVTRAAGRIPTLDAAGQAAWNSRLQLIIAALGLLVDVQQGSQDTQEFLQGAVQSALLTQAEVDSVCKRSGSQAESMFGEGTVIGQSDVSFALRGAK